MKRPPPTKRELQRFIKRSETRYPMELRLETSRPISIAESDEMARRILDHLKVELEGFEPPEALDEATLRCSAQKRVIKLFSR